MAWLREYPRDQFVTVGQEDYDHCHCKDCQALVEREGSGSALVLELANEVADRVAKEFPGKFVMAPAYDWGLRLPKTMRPRENVIISMAPISNDFGHPVETGTVAANVECREILEQWGKAARQIYIWDYLTDFHRYLVPFPNLDVLVPNVKYYTDHRVTGYLGQGCHTALHAEFSRLRMWVLAKAMWNPRADGQRDRGICEWVLWIGRPGDPEVHRHDSSAGPQQCGPEGQGRLGLESRHHPWPAPDVLVAAEGYLREAEKKAAGDPALEKRVRHAHMPLWYVCALRGPSSGTWRAINQKFGRITPAELATRLTAVIEEQKFGPTLSEGWMYPVEKFKQWLNEWGWRCGTQADLLPPELAASGADGCRLLQSAQMFYQQGGWDGTRSATRPRALAGLGSARSPGGSLATTFRPETTSRRGSAIPCSSASSARRQRRKARRSPAGSTESPRFSPFREPFPRKT